MDKKTIPLIIILGLVIVFYYPILEFLGIYKAPPPQPKTEQTTTAPDTTTHLAVPLPDTTRELSTETGTKVAPKPPEPAAELAADTIKADSLTIETNKYTVIMSSHGGGPVSMKLKEYDYRNDGPIEMLPYAAAATPDARFAGETFSTSKIAYTSNLRPGEYDATHDTLEVDYTYVGANGGTIVKKYLFYPDTYHYDLAITVDSTSALGFERRYTLLWNTPLGVTEPVAANDYKSMEAITMQGGSRDALTDYKDNVLNESVDGSTSWVGLRSKFFATALIPRNREGDAAVARGNKQNVATPEGKVEERDITAGIVMPFAGVEQFTDSFTVYVGPLDYLAMAKYNVDLEAMLDIGTMPFFGVILKPFAIAVMWLLPKLHDVIPNYGLVIIIFAIAVKLITLPLSMKQFKSMQGMKDIQPKLEELKKQYKKDPQGLQRETMKLYKSHGVNPMSGCLVMLPQMPLMIAMFRVFQATILLRNEPFVWFINDLSRGASGLTDPYIILVLFMVGTQLLSSVLTMSGGQQQKAFIYVFPIVIGFMLYSLPSGLILYWTVFSLLSLVDWFLFKRNKVKNLQVKTA